MAVSHVCQALYAAVAQGRDRYCAVLSDLKGCSNTGLLCQQALAYLERRYAVRFRYADRTDVARSQRRSRGGQDPFDGRRPRR